MVWIGYEWDTNNYYIICCINTLPSLCCVFTCENRACRHTKFDHFPKVSLAIIFYSKMYGYILFTNYLALHNTS